VPPFLPPERLNQAMERLGCLFRGITLLEVFVELAFDLGPVEIVQIGVADAQAQSWSWTSSVHWSRRSR
jgi:hypothetical protein